MPRPGDQAAARHRGASAHSRRRSAGLARPRPADHCCRRRERRFRVSDRTGDVDLQAVAASCAVPLVWPAVEIHGRHYVDGGMRSSTNADRATGCDVVVAIAPLPRSLTRYTALPSSWRARARSTPPRSRPTRRHWRRSAGTCSTPRSGSTPRGRAGEAQAHDWPLSWPRAGRISSPAEPSPANLGHRTRRSPLVSSPPPR